MGNLLGENALGLSPIVDALKFSMILCLFQIKLYKVVISQLVMPN